LPYLSVIRERKGSCRGDEEFSGKACGASVFSSALPHPGRIAKMSFLLVGED
jgi:hypothetical protein